MSELHRAVEAETAAFRPDRTPPFAAVLKRKRARDRRTRAAGAGALLAVAAAGTVLLPSALNGEPDTLAPATEPTSVATVDRTVYSVTYADVAAYEAERAAVDACLDLPGVTDVEAFAARPPITSVTVTGGSENAAFRACLDPISGVTLRTAPEADAGGDRGGLAPPAGADTLVLCLEPFEGPVTGRADCAITGDADQLAAVREVLGHAERTPPPEVRCLIGAATWQLVWLDGRAVVDRVRVPNATCLLASRADGADGDVFYTVSEELLDPLSTVYTAEAAEGGAFDDLADPSPPAAFCARRYPDDLAQMPLAFDGVVLGIADTDPRDVPESPGVPFSDVDVLVLDSFTGQPGQRLTVRVIGQPDPQRAVGERLLVATTSPPSLGMCGFTQPYSRDTTELWAEVF